MNYIETSIMALLDLIIYLMISYKLTSNITHLNIKNKGFTLILTTISLSLIMGLLGTSNIGNYSFIYGGFFLILFIYFLYWGNLKETIFLYIISTTILLIVQILIIFILRLFGIHEIFAFKVGLIAQSLLAFVLYLLNKYINLDLIFKYIYSRNKLSIGLILNMFVIAISFLIYRYIEMEGLLKDIVVIAILSIGILYVNFVLLKNGLRNEYEQKLLLQYKRYLPIIDDLMEKIRAKQHEFDNHIQALNMISLTCTDYESVVGSMKKYIEELNVDTDMSDLIKLDNKILAGFLYEKLQISRKENIDFKVMIDDYGFVTKLKDYELIEVVGNLIDNAFETNIEIKLVEVLFKREEDMNVIEVKNKHPYLSSNIISNFFRQGFSTKTGIGHGYGLFNVKKIVDKNNGIINIYNENLNNDNYVVFRILLP